MAQTPSFRQSPVEYDQDSENLFRRELETVIMIAMAVARNIASGESSIASHSIKRHQYQPPVGVATFI
jgi:hypothetical protein